MNFQPNMNDKTASPRWRVFANRANLFGQITNPRRQRRENVIAGLTRNPLKHLILIPTAILLFVGNTAAHSQVNERVYMQTDKQLYLAGELLWLKLYTTDTEGRLLSLSKTGYVELVRDSIPEVQIKIDILDGTGAGWMELPAMLKTGYYRMIAYTRYMRNEGENVFFEKRIAIVNPFSQNNEPDTDDAATPFTFPSIETGTSAFELSANKSSYAKREKGEIRIKGLPAEHISIGVSITGTDPLLIPNPTIHEWKKQLRGNSLPFESLHFLPEYEGAIIDGVLIDLETGAPAEAPDATGLLSFPGNEIQLFTGKTDEHGRVSFFTQCVTGKHELTTTALAPPGKKYRIDMQSPFSLHSPAVLPVFNPDSAWIDYLQDRNLSVQVSHAYLADSLSKIKALTPCTRYRPYSRYVLDEYTRFPNMEEVFIEFIAHASIRRTNEGRRFAMMNELFTASSTNILVLFDNIPVTEHELMLRYNPLLIKSIELHIGYYVFGGQFFDGMIVFYSYQHDFPGITFGESTQIYDYEGAQPYRFFYSPDYNETRVTSRLPDFRHTLLWEPFIRSNQQNELIIPFTTSDHTGSHTITIEGIGINGTVIQATQTFEVK